MEGEGVPVIEKFSSGFLTPRSERARIPRSLLRGSSEVAVLTSSRRTKICLYVTRSKHRVFMVKRPRCSEVALSSRCGESLKGKLGPRVPRGCCPGSSPRGGPVLA